MISRNIIDWWVIALLQAESQGAGMAPCKSICASWIFTPCLNYTATDFIGFYWDFK